MLSKWVSAELITTRDLDLISNIRLNLTKIKNPEQINVQDFSFSIYI